MLLRKTPTGVLYRHKTHNLSVEDIRQQRYTFPYVRPTLAAAIAVAVAVVDAFSALSMYANVYFFFRVFFVHLANALLHLYSHQYHDVLYVDMDLR